MSHKWLKLLNCLRMCDFGSAAISFILLGLVKHFETMELFQNEQKLRFCVQAVRLPTYFCIFLRVFLVKLLTKSSL